MENYANIIMNIVQGKVARLEFALKHTNKTVNKKNLEKRIKLLKEGYGL